MRYRDMKNERDEGEGEDHLRLKPMESEYPYGLCIRLTEKELEKLDLCDDVQTGDFLHGAFMAKVTSVSSHDHEKMGKGINIELQIVAMAIEDEATEIEDEDDEEY
jgi:hypothetical protein